MNWLPIKGFEGYYEISDEGILRSLDRTIITSNGNSRRLKGQEIKPNPNNKGYLQGRMRRDGEQTTQTIHKMVYETFIGEIPEGLEIDHIDNDKTNNKLSNLRLLTHSQNMERVDNNRKTKIAILYKNGIKVEYPSITEAVKNTGISKDTFTRILNGKSTGYMVFHKHSIQQIVLVKDLDVK